MAPEPKPHNILRNILGSILIILVMLLIAFAVVVFTAEIKPFIDYIDHIYLIAMGLLALFTINELFKISKQYRQKLSSLHSKMTLEANERFDFLYQDIFYPVGLIALVFFIFRLLWHPEKLQYWWVSLHSITFVGGGFYMKFILRNKLILTKESIIYSKYGKFEDIHFSDIQHLSIDEDNGKFIIIHQGGKKVFRRHGIFPNDWEKIKKTSLALAEEHGFSSEFIPAGYSITKHH